MPEQNTPSYADQIRTIAVKRINIVDEIDDKETLEKFRKTNPRCSTQRSRIEHLDQGHLLIIEDSKRSTVSGMIRRIQKANPNLKYKLIRANGKLILGHDVIHPVV